MNDRQRQTFLFVATLATGLVLLFLDIPVLWMLLILLIVGLLFLVLTGAITATDLRSIAGRLRRTPSSGSEAAAENEKQTRVPLFGRSKKQESDTTPEKEHSERRPLFAGIKESLGEFRASRKSRSNVVKNAVAAAAPEQTAPAPPPTSPKAPSTAGPGTESLEARPAKDPFLSLSDEELQGDLLGDLEDLDALDTSSLDEASEAPPPPAAAMPELVMESIPEGGDVFEDAAAAILAEHASDLEEFTDLEGIDEIENELSSLDESDLADSELEGLEIDAGEMAALAETPGMESLLGTGSEPEPPPGIPEVITSTPVQGIQSNPGDEMAAFAAGATGSERDMLSLLASETKRVRVKQDVSLLRDLKDVHVSSEELITELEEVLTLLGGGTEGTTGRSSES
ncbi:MAG TPA: hypothetical protein PK089_05660 [Methanoregulaceae archaeon]|nr:hypothetical protein [Methanoregulaceae archaeon]